VSRVRFLLDEHINRAIQRQLRRWDARIEVLAVGDPGVPPSGSSDQAILGWIEHNGYILITENRRTIPGHLSEHFASGRRIPGVFWLRPGADIAAIIESLYLIWLASDAEEYQDRMLYLPFE
jgi:hypothetical protein